MLLAPLPILRKVYDDVKLLIQEQGVEGLEDSEVDIAATPSLIRTDAGLFAAFHM